MSSPITYPVVLDDKDLDDAALWAMIDSATASHSSSKRKPLAIKYPNCQSPSPISKPSPPSPTPSKFPRISQNSGDGGEVVHDPWPYRPPRKIARTSASDSGESSPLALVRNVQRTPPAKVYSSSEVSRTCVLDSSERSPLALVRNVQRTPPAKVYSSPETGKLCEAQELSSYTEVSPRCFGRNDEEKENIMRHGLSGRFPSVSLFKEYQNAAMAGKSSFIYLDSYDKPACLDKFKAFIVCLDWHWGTFQIQSTSNTKATNSWCEFQNLSSPDANPNTLLIFGILLINFK